MKLPHSSMPEYAEKEGETSAASRTYHLVRILHAKGPSFKPQWWRWRLRWAGVVEGDTDASLWEALAWIPINSEPVSQPLISYLAHQAFRKRASTHVCLQFPYDSQKNTNEIAHQESQGYFCLNWQVYISSDATNQHICPELWWGRGGNDSCQDQVVPIKLALQ